MPYLNLYDSSAERMREVPMGTIIDYDIPDSGSYTDPEGRTWTISSSGDVNNNIRQTDITFSGDVSIEKILQVAFAVLPSFRMAENLGDWYNDISASMNPLRNSNHDTYPYLAVAHSSSNTAEGNRTIGLATSSGNTFSYGLTSYRPQPSYYACFIAIQDTSGSGHDYYYGFLACKNWWETESSIKIARSKTINSDNLAELLFDPGDKGFKPTGARTKKTLPGIGGRPSGGHGKDPEYKSDPITQPGEPDETHASASGSGFLKAYKVDTSALEGVGACLFGSTLEGKLANIFVNPLDFLISLTVFPAEPYSGTSTPIKLGRYKCKYDISDPEALGVSANGNPLTKQYKTFDFGTLAIPENWGNFLDYERTTIELYLPFIGTVNIDPSEVLGGTINVQYTIDFFTGQCVANVLCTKSMELPSGQALSNINAQHSFQGNCATQIPLSRVDYGAMVGNLINACTQAISNPVGTIVNTAEGVANGAFRPNTSSKGNIVANSGYCSVLYPYVRITRPITAEPESYQEVTGYPSYINGSVGECLDLCVCDDIDIKGANSATESELSRIKQLCREGIYV